MNQYRHLSAFPENREVLQALQGARRRHRHPEQRRPGDAGRGRAQRRPRRPARPRAERRQRAQVQDASRGLPPRHRRPPACRPRRSCSSAAMPGTRWPPPGSATARCGSTATSCPSRSSARSPRAPAHAARRARLFPLISIPRRTSMTARTTVHGLQVATALHRFIDDEVLPGTGVDSAALLERLRRHRRTTWRRRTPRCWPSATACRPSWTPGTSANPGPIRDMPAYRGFLEQIGYLVPPPAGREGHHRQRRRRTRAAGRPAAGGAHPERALRAQRRQRALGLAVRRAVRHRRHPRDRRRRQGPAATTRCAAPR